MKKHIREFLNQIDHYNRLVDDYKRAVGTSPDHALAYVNWGIDLAQDGKLDEALLKFEQASEISPNRYEPYLNWGVALAKLNRLDDAIDKFRLAIEKDNKAAMPYILWGAALMEQGKTDEAREKYEQAIALGSENPEPYVNWGIALSRLGQYHEAIRQFKQALAIHGYQPQVYFLWGAILAELQDYESAIEKFQLTLRFMPKHAETYFFWSVALNRLGRYTEALDKSKKALSLGPEKPEIYLNQGDILANMNRLDVAIANYRQAIALEPNLPEAYLSWGIALCRQENYDEGYTRFAKCLELDPAMSGVQEQWGHFLSQQKRYAEALPHLRLAVKENPENLEVLLNLSMALIKTGQQDEAIELLLEIEQKDRWNPQAHYLLGTHFMGVNNLEKAKAHLAKAIEEKPDFEEAAVNLALVMCEMGDTLEAIRQMRPVIRRLPDSARMNFFYGVILYRHGDYKEALTKYQKAVALDPEYAEAQIGLAEVLLRLARLDEAEQVLLSILEQRPQSTSSLYLMGLCQIRKADAATSDDVRAQANQKALHCFEQVIAQDPAHMEAHANQALMLGRLESVEAMNARFESLIAEYTSVQKAIGLYYWAKALEQLGEHGQSKEKMTLAHREFPGIEAQMETLSV